MVQTAGKIEVRMDYKISVYIPGKAASVAGEILRDNVSELDLGVPYAEMMRYRIDGKASGECNDVYYVCINENELVSRLWMGWGKHKNAVGNWGNFFTSPEYRGQGVGRKMLEFWQNDLKTRLDLPLALFCTAGDEWLAKLYAPYGFRPAIRNTACGPLYCPLKDSPETFSEFCEEYYKPANSLVFKPATLEWRHEMDCLFKFAMLDLELPYLPEGMVSLETSLLEEGGEGVEIIFTETNIPVGLAHTRPDGKRDLCLYPTYLHLI